MHKRSLSNLDQYGRYTAVQGYEMAEAERYLHNYTSPARGVWEICHAIFCHGMAKRSNGEFEIFASGPHLSPRTTHS